jgi:hypothetical protein
VSNRLAGATSFPNESALEASLPGLCSAAERGEEHPAASALLERAAAQAGTNVEDLCASTEPRGGERTLRPAPPSPEGVEPNSEAGSQSADPVANDHGQEVSDTARNTEAAGREKGEEVSEVATTNSQEVRQDEQHRPAENPAGINPGAGADSGGKPDQTPETGRGNNPSG